MLYIHTSLESIPQVQQKHLSGAKQWLIAFLIRCYVAKLPNFTSNAFHCFMKKNVWVRPSVNSDSTWCTLEAWLRCVPCVHNPPRTERKLLSGFSTLPSQIADNRLVAKTCHRSPPVTRQLDLSCYSVLVYHTHLFCCDFQKGFSRCLL